jgi:hypothetical protein
VCTGPHVSTRAGFAEPRTVKVLFEETFYNEDMKSFRVLCLSIPLEGVFPDSCVDETPTGQAALLRTVTEHMDWVREEIPRLLLSPSSPAHMASSAAAAAAAAKALSMSSSLSSSMVRAIRGHWLLINLLQALRPTVWVVVRRHLTRYTVIHDGV